MSDLLGTLRQDGDRLVTLAAGDLDAPVPTCPGWTLGDLLIHLGRVHRWAVAAALTAPDDERPRFGARPADGEAIGPWFATGVDQLVATFDGADPDTPAWAFVGPGTVGWWLRRQTLETAMHRWDAQLAATGASDPVDAEIAAIGIDEWCELESARWFRPSDETAMTVHLHATDDPAGSDELPGEWFLEADSAGLRWSHGHLKGDVAVRASRQDLWLAIWRRLPLSAVEVLGDADRLDDFLLASAVD
jgi:uncharacterized protein (TIGR03083 family)